MADPISCRTTSLVGEVILLAVFLVFSTVGVVLVVAGLAAGPGFLAVFGVLFVLIGMGNAARECLGPATSLAFDVDQNIVLWSNLFRHGNVHGPLIVRVERTFNRPGIYQFRTEDGGKIRFRLGSSADVSQRALFSALLGANGAIDAHELFQRRLWWRGVRSS